MINESQTLIEVLVGELLSRQKLTLAVAESCTGGLITHRLMNVPGSSEYLIGGVIAYAYEAKVAALGVTWETLNAFGAVSEETVRRLITERVLPARQLCKGAPWVIRADDLRLETVRQAANDRRARRPSSQDSRQNSIAL